MYRFGTLLLVTLWCLPASAADWPRFRGNNGTGMTADTVPLKWNDETILWSKELPFVGNGSPIVVNGKVYLQAAAKDGSARHLVCLNAKTGKQEWVTTLPGEAAHTHTKNSLSSSTPASDGERIYCLFWDGDSIFLYGFDLAGKELWKQRLGGYKSQHGPASSPMVARGKVIVNYDQDGAAQVVAFDGKTGDKTWSASRKAFRACYSTPFLRGRDNGSKEDLVVASTAGLTGYDIESGAIAWNWDWNFYEKPLRTVGSAVEAGNLIVAISGDGDGSRHAVVVDPEGANRTPELKWEKTRKEETPYVPGPIALKDHLYWVTDTGNAKCLELRTGKEIWSERAFPTSVSSSLILTQSTSNDPLILAIADSGRSIFFKASPEGFEKVADNDLKAPTYATPAVADGRLYLRAGSKLVCVGKK